LQAEAVARRRREIPVPRNRDFPLRVQGTSGPEQGSPENALAMPLPASAPFTARVSDMIAAIFAGIAAGRISGADSAAVSERGGVR
jgi:hypothetical protein